VVPRLGQKAPDFALPDTEGQEHSLGEFTKRGSVLVAFFPLAFSGVCDKEMCSFRDGLSELSAAGTQVVGLSVDSLFSLKAFAQTYNLQFPLLSDFNKRVTRLYGILQDPWVGFGYRGVAKRSVFLVDRSGLIRYKWITDDPSNEPPYGEVAKVASKIRR